MEDMGQEGRREEWRVKLRRREVIVLRPDMRYDVRSNGRQVREIEPAECENMKQWWKRENEVWYVGDCPIPQEANVPVFGLHV